MFTEHKFTYHRKNIPIMFNVPTKQETCIWEDNLLRTTRDFFRITRSIPELDSELILDCGLSLAEFSMFLVFTSWSKRMRHL